MAPFVHMKEQVFAMLNNSQLPGELLLGFQTANIYTSVTRPRAVARSGRHAARWGCCSAVLQTP